MFRSATAAALLLSLAATAAAFAPPTSQTHASTSAFRPSTSSAVGMIPEATEAVPQIAAGMDAIGSSVMVADEDMFQAGKTIFITLLFGGGLIPAAIIANKSMVGTLMKKRPEKPVLTEEAKKTYLDPTFGVADYVEDSGASGPNLAGSGLLFAPERIPLADVVAIVGRLNGVDSVAQWNDLPSTKLPNVSETNPPKWLPRATFKANVRKAKFQGWPVDDKGRPIGGEELKASEEKRISKANCEIGDAALDAVFDTWAWGANIATPDKVGKQLRSWRPDAGSFNQLGFTLSAISGRALIGVAALSFVIIQVVAYGTLFIAPALRVFANIDIGFGQMGACDPTICTKLF